MSDPAGKLTPAQHEIMDVVWQACDQGVTVAEIWQVIGTHRAVTRTTVLNLVDRLEKRGWLRRKKNNDGFRYTATRSRADASRNLAEEFVDAFFGGSACELVTSLLGSKRLSRAEAERLRELLTSKTDNRPS